MCQIGLIVEYSRMNVTSLSKWVRNCAIFCSLHGLEVSPTQSTSHCDIMTMCLSKSQYDDSMMIMSLGDIASFVLQVDGACVRVF